MAIETSRIKFQRCKKNGDIIGFVSQTPVEKQIRGVDESSPYPKKICLLSEDLKGTVEPGVLYDVELVEMHNRKGYVVISAKPALFEATIKTIVVPKAVYQVTVTFGNKVVYFDPKDGKMPSSRTIPGVMRHLRNRKDISDKNEVINKFRDAAFNLLDIMAADGYIVEHQRELFQNETTR